MDISITSLQDCIACHQSSIYDLADIASLLPSHIEPSSLPALIQCYEQCYPLLESAMWENESDFDALLDSYQSLFREQDVLIQQCSTDERYHFILNIPVADRPPHLRACLESVYQVCEKFGYGGKNNGQYTHIKIIVAEDSREQTNIQRHIDIIEEYQQKGLQVIHLNQDEQYQLLHSLSEQQRQQLGNILTTQPKEKFYLKGQAANRNLSYLKFLQLCKTADEKQRTLFYMVDSDQNFCVNRQTEGGKKVSFAINYFHHIDRLFRRSSTLMVTGKLVGDPPVSPSVMTANFLDDVTSFFATLAKSGNNQTCQFHAALNETIGDAAYHDMANLFGFEQQRSTYPYQCLLKKDHGNSACLISFANRLNAFFFGEHLTRKTTFNYGNGFTEHNPARTIYPGNYIVNYEGLKYIIPFGNLRLRMSGPTAGRLIAAEINDRFTSINIPHLHQRTTEAGLNDDFRPGVELEEDDIQGNIDLSNEFERQFFGDMMLFTTDALVKQADVSSNFDEKLVRSIIDEKETELLALYQKKHDAVLTKNNQLNDLVFNTGHWWGDITELKPAMKQIKTFINNVQNNFSEQSLSWQQIQSASHRAERKQQIINALINYRTERNAWDELF